jgi:hypothetical protein
MKLGCARIPSLGLQPERGGDLVCTKVAKMRQATYQRLNTKARKYGVEKKSKVFVVSSLSGANSVLPEPAKYLADSDIASRGVGARILS